MALQTPLPPVTAPSPPPAPPPAPSTRAGLLARLILATIAVVVAVGVAGFVLLRQTVKPATPVGVRVIATTAASVTVGWQAGSTETPTGYYLYRDGTRVASVSGTARSYRDGGLQPGAPYSYQVSAYASGVESSRSSEISVMTSDASLAASRLSGVYHVRLQVSGASGYPEVTEGRTYELTWSFTQRGNDSATVDGESWVGNAWTMSLAPSDATYAGAVAESISRCFDAPVPTTVRLAVTVRAADVVDADWTATAFTGTFTQDTAQTVSGTEVCPGAAFSGTVVGRLHR